MSTAVATAPMIKTDHASIKAKMLAVLAIVLDIQTSYEAYERPSEVNHEILEPLWRSRLENCLAYNVSFKTTPNRSGHKYELCIRFTLTVGQCTYTLQAIGIEGDKWSNSTKAWIRDVKRWPESVKAMEKKEAKGFHFPASNPKPNQATFDALQEQCTKDLEETYAHLVNCAVSVFSERIFDGTPTTKVGRTTCGKTYIHFKERPSIYLDGSIEVFEANHLEKFEAHNHAMTAYDSHADRAKWIGKWIDGMVNVIDNRKPSERYAEVVKVCEERVDAESQIELSQPTATGMTASYYKNPKTGLTKSFLVKGDTKPHKDAFKDIGGTWCKGLGGWIFGLGRENRFKADFPAAQWLASGSFSGKHP